MRVGAYRRKASFSVKEKQNEALNTTMCILQNYGPMGFLIQEENAKQKFKSQIKQRAIEIDDICPICQDKFLCHQRFPVTFCRKGCGNNVHIKCMKIWKDHQIKERNLDLIFKCFEQRTSGRLMEKSRFYWKEKISEKWRKIPWNFDILSGLDQHYVENNPRRSVSVWEALTKPLCRKELGRMAKWLIKAAHTNLPKGAALGGTRELGTARGLLTPGRQCRICLMHFREGEEVRKLLRCNHVFHTKCVDQWLLHVSPSCPLDGIIAVPIIPCLPIRSERDRSERCSPFQGTSDTLKNVGDILKISSFSDAARNLCVNSEARSHRDEVRFVTPPLEIKSAAICQSSSTNICTKKTFSTPIRPICKRTQETSRPTRRMSEKYWLRM
uniref:Zinc finger RING domain containing protein 2 n=1 Tax=Echinococcus granulosus TaxID=6210 RepID=A0A068W933_ECHGR|nr:zinc finger RING domain containing protein 2 [Echinococcus granulosus]